MVKFIKLNNQKLKIKQYKENSDGTKINIIFDLKSEDYHDITSLLYKGRFHIEVPEKNKVFTGDIINYFTDRTNLYEDNQTAEYNITFKEVNGDSQ